MKFFPKSGNFSAKLFSKPFFFFFLEKDIFKFHLQILENPKNFMISFFIPLGLNGVVGNEIWRASSFSHPQRFVGKKVLFKISFPQEMKSQTPNLHSQTSCSALISNFLSSSRSNQNIFHSSGWRMDFTFSKKFKG